MSSYQVKILQGILQGKIGKTVSGKTFLSFQGIPYAKPPVGSLRFKPPQPADRWSGIRDATKEGNVCPQHDLLTRKLVGKEDCLFLNVYTPKLKPKVPLPVMFFVHGGNWLMGSGNADFYGPKFLLDKEIILVTINYRLGSFGFLQLDTAEVPGNAGLRDQVAALQWVQNNIASFGGDRRNVTAFGNSVGAMAIHHLMLSPMGKGLFNKVILQSGSALSNVAFTDNGKERAFRLAKLIGKEPSTIEETLKYLQSCPVEDILKYQKEARLHSDDPNYPLFFAPTKEKTFEGVDLCIPSDPTSMIKSGNYNKVPIMIGYNNKEGLCLLKRTQKNVKTIDENFEHTIPYFLGVKPGTELSSHVAQQIKEYYFKERNFTAKELPAVVDWISDCCIVAGVNRSIEMHLQSMDSPVYMYRFGFSGKLNLFKVILGVGEMEGACHSDEVSYLFSQNFKKILHDESHKKTLMTVERMIQMWTDFAKFGNPTPTSSRLVNVKWPPLSRNNNCYLDIDEELKVDTEPDKDRAKFWKEIFYKCKSKL